MSVSLSKKQSVSLTKTNPGLQNIFMGLGWDAAKPKGGFFSKFFSSNETEDIDLDASCLMFDSNKKLVDTVWFCQLKSVDGSIYHSGDNRTGAGDGDDEVININLAKVPEKVTTLVFVITSFTGQTFNEIDSATCRVVNKDNNKEVVTYTLSEKGKNTAQIMAKVYRDNGEWHIQAIGEPTDGKVQYQLLSTIDKFL